RWVRHMPPVWPSDSGRTLTNSGRTGTRTGAGTRSGTTDSAPMAMPAGRRRSSGRWTGPIWAEPGRRPGLLGWAGAVHSLAGCPQMAADGLLVGRFRRTWLGVRIRTVRASGAVGRRAGQPRDHPG